MRIIAEQLSMLKKQTIIPALLILFAIPVFSQQTRFSLSTDVNVLRSFKKNQRYWAIGQTVAGHFHFTEKDGAYIWFAYYTKGRFSNQLTALAKLPATTPQQIPYSNNAKMSLRHVSIGWKHYFRGGPAIEEGWSLYGFGGFGLMIGQVENSHSVKIDSAAYVIPVLSGKGHFKRLTFDLGLGFERQLGGDVFFYSEGRVLVPTTDYPSKYIFVNDNAPFTATLNFGFRILF